MPKNDEPTAADLLDLDDKDAPRPVDLAAALDDAEEERLHPILTNAEFRAAQEKAHTRIAKEAREAAMKAVEETTLEDVRGKAGLVTGDAVKDEQVQIHLDLPEYMGSLNLNGVQYLHNGTYKVPRHVADSLREMVYRGHQHQNELDGKNIAERSRLTPRDTILAKTGVQNAPQAVAPGAGF